MPIIFLTDFYPKKVTLEFLGAFLLAKIFKKVTFDPYNFQITKLSAAFSSQHSGTSDVTGNRFIGW